LLGATLSSLPLAAMQWPQAMLSASAWAVVAALGVLCTGIAFVVCYRLIVRIGASRAATSTYLVPVFGIGWAWLLLGETPTAGMVLAGVLILGSVVLSQRGS
jgi:drug/metabolite transporter (DMT)-like permease